MWGKPDKPKDVTKKTPLWAKEAEVCLASSRAPGKVTLKTRNRQGEGLWKPEAYPNPEPFLMD